MDLKPITAKTHIFDICGGVPVPMRFVSEVLSLIVIGNKKEIRIQVDDFLWDRKKVFDTTSLSSVEINSKNVVEMKSKTEITLLGTVRNQRGKRMEFSLYFFMWWHCHGSMPNKEKDIISLRTDTLHIHYEEKTQQVSNAVFNVLLCQEKTLFPKVVLGGGRGVLLVGSGQDIIKDEE